MSGSVVSAANKLGGGKAQPALQLVGYEGEVEAAIKYAFGSAFVCEVRGLGLRVGWTTVDHFPCLRCLLVQLHVVQVHASMAGVTCVNTRPAGSGTAKKLASVREVLFLSQNCAG
jgi:hypothetical protein